MKFTCRQAFGAQMYSQLNKQGFHSQEIQYTFTIYSSSLISPSIPTRSCWIEQELQVTNSFFLVFREKGLGKNYDFFRWLLVLTLLTYYLLNQVAKKAFAQTKSEKVKRNVKKKTLMFAITIRLSVLMMS